MVSLGDRIAEIVERNRAVFDPHETRMAALVDTIGQVAHRPQPGDEAPDFALPTAGGKLARMADLAGPRGLVLLFIRGLWCPYCNAQMVAFEERADGFAEAGLAVAVVTPEIGGRAARTKALLGLSAEVLCDVDEGMALSYGCLLPLPREERVFLRAVGYDLAALYGNEGWFMPMASTFVIGTDGRVAAVLGGADQRRRPDPDAVLQAAGQRPSGS
ncbi:MAG: peroxiredoxin-like family protein [Pseudomonadota bacterium]